MKILVIDDKKENLEAAEDQLGSDHDLYLASNFEEAEHYIGRLGYEKFDRTDRFVDISGWDTSEEKTKKFLEEVAIIPDVVLTDLLIPSSMQGIGDSEVRAKYQGKEMPYGLVFALGALRRGVKYIGINSDGNHHDHPMLWAMDMLGFYDSYKDGYTVDLPDTTFVCGGWLTENSAGQYVKNWKAVLDRLTSK